MQVGPGLSTDLINKNAGKFEPEITTKDSIIGSIDVFAN